jgi:hypothetical protein
LDSNGEVGEASVPTGLDLYLADYDLLPFEDVHNASSSHSETSSVALPQLSSYMIRKSLIRKNHLAHSLHLAKVKADQIGRGEKRARLEGAQDAQDIAPMTVSIELTGADELDELLADDLYDVRQILEENEGLEAPQRQWFILKPAMADQGMGIRLFDTVDSLNAIFEEFEDLSDDDEEEVVDRIPSSGRSSTAVVTSQVRQFVVQRYLSHPLLIQAPTLQAPHKFHIRAYVLAQGSLRVFLYDEMLALFAPEPYCDPGQRAGHNDEADSINLSRHLTNTSRQDDDQSQRTVHLLTDLLGCPMGADSAKTSSKLTSDHLYSIKAKAAAVVARTFLAVVQAGRIHFQPWPNAWEIFGVDLMVTVDPSNASDSLRVWLLEVNAQPDFAKSGPQLQQKIDTLFARSLQICTLGQDDEPGTNAALEWQPGESRNGMTLCLDLPTSAGGW